MEIDWRLPARLRRPVRLELARQRRKKRQREAIVQFKRRPLYPLSNEARVARPPGPANVGAEHHTGDVYRASRPFLAASVPPYGGSFLRRKSKLRYPAAKRTMLPAASASQPPRAMKPTKQPIVGRSILSGERDVPYQWAAPVAKSPSPVAGVEAAPVTPPRRRFALPLHLSIWPFKSAAVRPGQPVAGQATTKKKVHNSDSLTSSFL